MKGQLKIFYSYIAGAGKTYAMLEAAHQLLNSGKDVVVGYVEPHTRPDTLALLDGLEVVPPVEVRYKGMILKDLDLNAILKRKPDYVLIDELAHTNAPGLHHVKRYQDVLDVLDAGISVYSTVNIQHLDSLHDIIEQISGIDVKETIPDYIFDGADQVELVDIEPADMQNRLRQGKVYDLGKVDAAIENFFTYNKLSALREVALRRGAERISEENLKNRMFSNEVILVCISQYKSNPRVIRTAARMAKAFRGRFQALYVESSNAEEMSEEDRQVLENNIKLAKALGAQITHVYGEDIGEQIISYAKMTSVTKLVIGRSKHRFFKQKSNIVDYITEHAPDMDVHIIPYRYEIVEKGTRTHLREKLNVHMAIISLIILVLCAAVSHFFDHADTQALNSMMTYMIGLVVIAYVSDRLIYPLISCFIAIALYNFFDIAPFYTFKIYGTQNIISYIFMIAVTMFISVLTSKLKHTSVMALHSSNRTASLLNATRRLNKANNKTEVYNVLREIMRDFYEGDMKILSMEDVDQPSILNDEEMEIVKWSIQNRHSAGKGTDTLPNANITCFPIRTHDFVGGVMCIGDANLNTDQKNMIKAILAEAASLLDRFTLLEREEKHRFIAEKERLKLTLLRGVSHDMRTPLAIIQGNSFMLETNNEMEETDKRALARGIYTEAAWMGQMIDNLLNMTRVTSEAFQLNKHLEILEDIIQTAIMKCESRKGNRQIQFDESNHSRIINVDSALMLQVLINLIDNAIKHTSDNGLIDIRITDMENAIKVSVIDDGEGITEDIIDHIFDDFLTTDSQKADAKRGMGLGLGICKRIVEEHGGEMFARNLEKGTEIGFCLKGAGYESKNIDY